MDRYLRSNILRLIRQNTAMRAEEIVEITGAEWREVRSVCFALCNAKQLDFCSGYFALAAPAQTPGRLP